MWEALERLLSGSFMPHGHCYLWSPEMVWLQVLSNLLIAIAYFSISATLYYIIRRIRDIPFSWMYLAFGVFIVTCGGTHLLDVVTIWRPVYWLDGGLRTVTAVASLGTALLLFPLVPKAIALADAAKVAHDRGLELESTYKDLAVAHEKTKHVEQLKTRFFANVSHELRTPLALILGPLERLLASPVSPEQRHDLDVAARNARTLLKHVNDLLDVSRLEAGKMGLEYARIDLARLVRYVAGHFEALAVERGMRLRIDAPAELFGEVDPDKLETVVVNLVSNAFKFTPDAGDVRLTLQPVDGDTIRFEVGDSGSGVPVEARTRIFERFAQADVSETRRAGGTGLGLAIAKDFVELHGGTIGVGDAPEGGAAFAVEIPARAPEGRVVASPREHAGGGGAVQAVEALRVRAGAAPSPSPPDAARVLVVEDNPEMSELVVRTLEAKLAVETAVDGEEGLAKARRCPPDLVITDMMMPRMSGEELVAALRADPALRDVAILVLTAKADDEVRTRMLRAGAQDYLMKPFSIAELEARASNLVTMKRVRDVLRAEISSQERDLEAMAADLARKKREVEQASRAKTAFLQTVSHELRTPLASLQLVLDGMSSASARLADRERTGIERMMRSTARLTDLVQSLLQAARLQNGAVEIRRSTLDVRDVIDECVDELRGVAEKKGLSLTVHAPEPLEIDSDRSLVRLVVANIVSNAVKFTTKGEVTITAGIEGDERVVRVRDTGPGIAPQDIPRVFEAFTQLGPVEHKHTPGVGLGLSIVREAIARLGGRIEISSEPGTGTAFEIRLPRSIPERWRTSEAHPAAQ